jgi:hypothetical protein
MLKARSDELPDAQAHAQHALAPLARSCVIAFARGSTPEDHAPRSASRRTFSKIACTSAT